MDDEEYEEAYGDIIKALGAALAQQKAIFEKYQGRAINPDGSEEYLEAKKKFDAADRRIKAIEKELAQIEAAREPDYKSFLERMGDKLDKLISSDDDDDESVALGVRG
jgi:hypothetical protein